MRKFKGLLLVGSLLTFLLIFPINNVNADEHVHQWTDWKLLGEPSCKDGISEERYCPLCMTQEFRYRESNDHKWGNWITLSDNTCTKDGQKYRQCSVCEKIEYSSIPKDSNKHLFSTWNTKSPTIFASGYKTRTCLYCGKKEHITLNKISVNVYLNKKSIKLHKKGTYTLRIKRWAKTDKVKRWKSSKKSIATVNSRGKIKAKKKGKAIITLYMKSGAKASCKVTVK